MYIPYVCNPPAPIMNALKILFCWLYYINFLSLSSINRLNMNSFRCHPSRATAWAWCSERPSFWTWTKPWSTHITMRCPGILWSRARRTISPSRWQLIGIQCASLCISGRMSTTSWMWWVLNLHFMLLPFILNEFLDLPAGLTVVRSGRVHG